jgi:hypothetical protein
VNGTRFSWVVSYQGETEFNARLESGRTITLALRWRAVDFAGGSTSQAEHEREILGAVGIVRDYRDSREPITPELFENFRAWYERQGTYPRIELSRGYYSRSAGWVRV